MARALVQLELKRATLALMSMKMEAAVRSSSAQQGFRCPGCEFRASIHSTNTLCQVLVHSKGPHRQNHEDAVLVGEETEQDGY